MQRYVSAAFTRAIVHSRPITTSRVSLSGHNKWSKIKERKGATDALKGALYGKVNRDILVAIRNGTSSDPEQNQVLASVIKRAKEQGVPKDNIQNALKRATGGKDGKASKPVSYEAIVSAEKGSEMEFVGFIIECFTDNPNRTVKMIQDTLSSCKGRLSTTQFLFDRYGYIRLSVNHGDDVDKQVDKILDEAVASGVDDFVVDNENDPVLIDLWCPVASLAKITASVTAPELCTELVTSELSYAPREVKKLDTIDEGTQTIVDQVIARLETSDDVVRVWTTLDRGPFA